MAITNPIGQIRLNPNTFMQEVWDGKDWNVIDDANNFTTIPIHSISGAVSSSYTTSMQPIGSSVIMNESRKEDIYHFLMKNLRVAEYLDDTGKIDYVQLELREDENCIWENIQRVRIKR